jgi:hypothetical protein
VACYEPSLEPAARYHDATEYDQQNEQQFTVAAQRGYAFEEYRIDEGAGLGALSKVDGTPALAVVVGFDRALPRFFCNAAGGIARKVRVDRGIDRGIALDLSVPGHVLGPVLAIAIPGIQALELDVCGVGNGEFLSLIQPLLVDRDDHRIGIVLDLAQIFAADGDA